MAFEYKKLRGRIREMYDSEGNFAEEIGVSKQSMSLKLNCKTGFSQEDIELWANKLNIDPAEYAAYFFA